MRGGDRRRVAALLGAGAIALAIVLLIASSGSHQHRRATSTPSVPPTTPTTVTVTTPAPVATPAPVGPPAQPPLSGEQFGANVNRLFNGRSYDQAQIDGQLQALRLTGATVARSDALWEFAEPQPPVGGVHHYDWTFADSIAGSLASHGLRWLPVIDYTAAWAQSIPGQDHSPPGPVSDYAAYAAAVAARYGRGGSFWRAHPGLAHEAVNTYEIWNEPDDTPFWVPAPDAGRYDELYLQARDAITAVDPTARVIVGGLTHPDAFLPAMLAARPDLRGHVDGIAIHPYWPKPAQMLAAVRADRALLRSLGLANVQLYVTEFGWTTRPPRAQKWAPERLRPGYIQRTVATLGHSDCGIAAVVLYTWVTPERDPANLEDWFGIHPPAGGSSADSQAFAAALQQASGGGPPIRLCSS